MENEKDEYLYQGDYGDWFSSFEECLDNGQFPVNIIKK